LTEDVGFSYLAFHR